MMLRQATCLLIAAVTLVAASSTPENGGPEKARILASKKVHNNYLVEGADVVVQYYLYNIGTAPALNVQLTDNTFSSDLYEIAGGQLQVKFERIPPGSNVSHTVVVRPKRYGYHNFTAAEVSYQPSEDSAEIQVGYTSEPGEGGVFSQRDFDRKFSPHVFDWVIFAVLLIPVLVVPFLMWRKISTKYAISPKSAKGGKKN